MKKFDATWIKTSMVCLTAAALLSLTSCEKQKPDSPSVDPNPSTENAMDVHLIYSLSLETWLDYFDVNVTYTVGDKSVTETITDPNWTLDSLYTNVDMKVNSSYTLKAEATPKSGYPSVNENAYYTFKNVFTAKAIGSQGALAVFNENDGLTTELEISGSRIWNLLQKYSSEPAVLADFSYTYEAK